MRNFILKEMIDCDETYIDSSYEEEMRELLEQLVNTPPIKIPLWIEQHKKELKELGINIKNG